MELICKRVKSNDQLYDSIYFSWNSSVFSNTCKVTTLNIRLQGFSTSTLTCTFTTGISTDVLEITQASTATSTITGTVRVRILNIRAPPSLSAVTTITVQTTNSNTQLIDQSTSGQLSYLATTVASLDATSVKISATTPKINSLTTMTVQVRNTNPLPASSTLEIVIPSEIGVTSLTTVTGTGRVKASPSFTLSSDKRTVTVSAFNENYLEPLVNMYFHLSSVTTPSTTIPTSTFSITLKDADGQLIEQGTSGIFFTASPGTLTSNKITPNNYYIRSTSVQYKFTFKPQDSLSSSAIIKITFPDQISISNRASSALTSFNSVVSSSARVTVTSNKYAVITNAISSSYNLSTDAAIEVTLNGITNPSSIVTTDSFQISIYKDDTDVISLLTSGLTLTMKPNPYIDFEVLLNSEETGVNNIIQFKGDSGNYAISKGSYLVITIPAQFEIYDYTIAQQTCVVITGFSDEVSCTLSRGTGGTHKLVVADGFNTQIFSGGEFALNISQIRNPKTSKKTDSFTFEIRDSDDNQQFIYEKEYFTTMVPQGFQHAIVSSSSPVNGQSAIYTFTLTFSVDTEIDSNIQVYIPDDISIDKSKNQTCQGILNLNKTFGGGCILKNDKVFVLRIRSDKNNVTKIANGTSVSFQLGSFFNPISLRESQPFVIETYEPSNSNTQYYLINRDRDNVRIQNTEKGAISNFSITQYGTELNSPTSLRITFNTQNRIPKNSRIVITIPNNMQTNQTKDLAATLNNQSVSVSFTSSSRQVRVTVPQTNLQSFVLNITKGLLNPYSGPYTYGNYLIEVQTSLGDSIDSLTITNSLISSDAFKAQNPLYTSHITHRCQNNCTTCSGSFTTCTTCQFDSLLNTTFYLSNGKCSETCPTGQWGDTADFQCKKCEYPCVECQYGAQLCTKCYANHSAPFAYPQTLSCYSECPSGTYLDKTQNLCVKCHSPCFTCLDKDRCLSCDRTNKTNLLINYYQNKCYKECPSGTVSTPQSSICIPCTSPCKTCSDGQPDQCSSCIDGYFNLRKSLCVQTCPTQYLANTDTMTCDFAGEMVFPLPFSILTAVFALGLFVARFMKNQTKYFITLLAFTDTVLKLNWVFLLLYLYIGKFYVSASIIAYCNIANVFLNIGIWRTIFYRKKLDEDMEFRRYSIRYKWTSKFLTFASFFLSFHIFRLQYSRLLGKRQFSAAFRNFDSFVSVLSTMTLANLVLLCFPAVAANAYNLFYAQPHQQVYYFDIDGLILVIIECLIVTMIVKQGEKMQMLNSQLLKSLMDKGQDSRTEDQKKVDNMIDQMRRQSLARKHFGKDQDLTANKSQDSPDEQDIQEIADDYSRNIFKNLMKQFQTQTSNQTPSQKYLSQQNLSGIDLEEYKRLKQTLKQLHIAMYNLKLSQDRQNHRKTLLSNKLNALSNDNKELLSKEERLKAELDELKDKLQIFREVTSQELQETENMRRDHIKHKMSMHKLKQFIGDTVIEKGKEIVNQRKRKAQPSYNAPTISQLMKDQKEGSTERKKRGPDNFSMSLHQAKPPINQKDRSKNRGRSTMAKSGAKFIENRVGLAINYPQFRASSEMRVTRNIENINKNAFGIGGTEVKVSPEKPFSQAMYEPEEKELGGSADKRLKKLNYNLEDAWLDDFQDNQQ